MLVITDPEPPVSAGLIVLEMERSDARGMSPLGPTRLQVTCTITEFEKLERYAPTYLDRLTRLLWSCSAPIDISSSSGCLLSSTPA